MQDPTHVSDGLYSTENWIIDQTEFSKRAAVGHKRKKLFTPKEEAQAPQNEAVRPAPPKKTKDADNLDSKMEDNSHKVDTRAAAFLGKSKKPRVEAMEYEMNPMVSRKAKEKETAPKTVSQRVL